MNGILDYYDQAMLALAAYSNLVAGMSGMEDEGYKAALQAGGSGLSPTQASSFASKWKVIDQYTHSHTEVLPTYDDAGNLTGYTTLTSSNGLSVTVFEDIATGKRHVAIRGTEFTDIGDLTADGGIILHGVPQLSEQYQALKTQIEAWQSNGTLAGTFTVTGHSLGGWLAAGLAKDFAASIEHTYVYNAPGVGGADLYGELLQQLNEALGTSFLSPPNVGNLTNIYASTGISPITGMGWPLSPPIGILIEDQRLLDIVIPGGPDTPLSLNHSQRVLTDSLAVYALFAGMSATITVDDIGAILRASGNRDAMTLEDAVNALGEFFEAGIEILGNENRDDLYVRMQAIRDSAGYQLAEQAKDFIKVQPLSNMSRDQIVAKAQLDTVEGLAYRYAIVNMIPFAISGDTALYSLHNASGQLDTYNATTGQGELTDLYLKDRAAMLSWKMKYDMGVEDFDDSFFYGDRADKPYSEEWDTWDVSGDWDFIDLTTGIQLSIDGTNLTTDQTTANHRIVFGSAASENIAGGELTDHLYGGGGDDTLTGNAEADRLEGNAGDDQQYGGTGNDKLLGGGGADTLAGGQGNDYLEGGAGDDTYVINAGDGFDTVLDADGQGVVKFGEINAQGSVGLDASKWVRPDPDADIWVDRQNGITYTKSVIEGETQLRINKDGSSVLIKGWSDGELGIELGAGTPASPPATTANSTGTANQDFLIGGSDNDLLQGLAGTDYLSGLGGDDVIEGGDGNDVIAGGSTSDDDTLYGGDGDDLILGDGAVAATNGTNPTTLTQNNLLTGIQATLDANGFMSYTYAQPANVSVGTAYGPGGDDTIYAGMGNDVVHAGGGSDLVDGGADADIISGDGGDDILLGQGGNDILIGDAINDGTTYGDDYLNGGDGNDKLWGVGGNDSLQGGVGDDYLDGDGNLDTANDGEDVLDGGIGNDHLAGRGGDDLLLGGAGTDVLDGGDGSDTLDGGEGIDTLYGGAGDDTLTGASGDYLAGGAGNDIYIINGEESVFIFDNEGENLLVVDDVATLDPAMLSIADGGAAFVLDLGNSQSIRFSSGLGSTITLQAQDGSTLNLQAWAAENITDSLVLQQGDAGGTLYGGAANDVLNGGSGNDTLLGQGGNDTLNGNAGNDTLGGGEGNDILNGGAGDDVYLVSDYSDTLIEQPGEGTDTVRSSVTYALGGNLENLELTGSENIDGTGNELDNVLIGNAGNNVLAGGAGNDSLNGEQGVDTLAGGAGNDVYVVADDVDALVEAAGEGIDTVISSISYALVNHFERLELAGTENIDGTGNDLDNVLIGNAGNNTLAGGAGKDILGGGAGDDTYIVTDSTDTLSESSGNGFDTVKSSITYTLAANIERLELTGTASINGAGNDLDNVLVGNEGVNKLMGGRGDDTYIISDLNDNLVELSGEGMDTVMSSVSYALQNQFENLILTGSADINGSGHNGDNKLTGNDGNNTLSGGNGSDVLDGGAGADILKGGDGNDTYIINDDLDVISDSGGGGDTVMASVSYALDSDKTLENLILTGTASIDGSGNSDGNVITGNSGNNTLQGFAGNDTLDGGAGADNLVGGRDHDTYVIDDAGDIVTELAGEGTDKVLSSISYTLAANVENLLLTGDSPINGTGNSLNNTITGNSGDNILDGGFGADTLQGGAGNDLYFVDSDADKINELAGEGTEQVMASDSYVLSMEVENLTLVEGSAARSATGNELNNILIGNSSNNTLVGNGGDDFIDGGAGADVMKGGFGDDIFIVDNAGDMVSDSDKKNIGTDLDPIWVYGGTDTVLSSVSFAISNFVENLILTGTDAINGSGNGSNENITGNSASNILTGNGGNDTLDGGAGADRLIGGNGNDTLVVDEVGDVVVELYGQGTDTVVSSISYALANDLENLTLTGQENLNGEGNNANNILTGNDGINTLTGKLGNDSYHVQNTEDIIVEQAGEGTDTVYSTVDYALGANLEVLTLIGTGSISGTGNTLNNTITGNAGDNILDGGAGSDTLVGGLGNDTYIVDSTGDRISEVAGEGTDTVQVAMAYTLGSNLENLTLTGNANITGSGNTLNNVLIGNEGNNTLTGGDGNDTMYGAGGADILKGGNGDDTYIIEDLFDTLSEGSGAGTDTVQSSITYTLISNFENLVLGGAANINGTGTNAGNLLAGNAGENILTGLGGNDILDGGAGADTLVGGTGDDTYVVDDAADIVTEISDEGTDTIQSYISYTLGANVERLTLIGAASVDGTGNAANNIITGNAGNNVLDGGGGTDALYGGLGDDTYIINGSNKTVAENVSEGNDTVQSNITYALGANIENLVLIGTNAINGTGNELNNVLIGNSANNNLSGNDGDDFIDGMEGADNMNGGFGDDIFIVDNEVDVAVDVDKKNVGTDLNPIYVYGGTDTVLSSVSFSLSKYIENLTLTGQSAINGTGNTLNNMLVGNNAANTLSGLNGNDSLKGGAGADTLNGGTGNDTYLVGRGDGAEVIQDYQSSSNTDILSFGPDISAEQIWFRQSGNDLEISIIGTQDSVSIQDWYLGSAYHVEQITLADGSVLLDTQVQALVDAMAAFAPLPEGQSTLPQNYESVLLGLIDANWTIRTSTSSSTSSESTSTTSLYTGIVSKWADPSTTVSSGGIYA